MFPLPSPFFVGFLCLCPYYWKKAKCPISPKDKSVLWVEMHLYRKYFFKINSMSRGGINVRLSSQPWEVEEGRTPGPPLQSSYRLPGQPELLSETLIQRKENKENDHGSEIFCPYLRLINKYPPPTLMSLHSHTQVNKCDFKNFKNSEWVRLDLMKRRNSDQCQRRCFKRGEICCSLKNWM